MVAAATARWWRAAQRRLKAKAWQRRGGNGNSTVAALSATVAEAWWRCGGGGNSAVAALSAAAARWRCSAQRRLKLGGGVAAAAIAQWWRSVQRRRQLDGGVLAAATAQRLQLECGAAVVALVVELSATAAAAWRLCDGSGGSAVATPAN